MKKIKYDLNGFSNWEKFEIEKKNHKNFSLTFACIPYTYESCKSCLFSSFNEKERKGMIVSVGKQGKVTVQFGLGFMTVDLESTRTRMEFQKRNLVTIDFWGTAGWCYLYVNGKLAGIKQFPRNSVLPVREGILYVGKNMLLNQGGMKKRGMFHGVLEFIDLREEHLYSAQVEKMHNDLEEETEAIDLYRNLDFSNDIYRPVYHLIPRGKWMNEPHAPFYYKGKYHIFYQANPHAPIWDNLCWGHLVSKDMVNWEDVGIAMYPDTPGLDMDGIWSGSACVNNAGTPLLFYTAGNNQKLPNQSVALAVPVSLQDEELRKWDKKGIILEQQEEQGFLGEFRDPFVWQTEDTYYILMGSGDSENGGGNALLYSSKDLKQFQYHGYILNYCFEEHEEVGHVWELPVLLPLRDEKGEHAGDILMFCACQIENEIVENYYFLGHFDSQKKKFIKIHEEPRLFDLGCGTFTGPSGFVTEDGRSVVFTIAQGKRKPDDEFTSGWAHNGGMPIQLRMVDGKLINTPIQEAYACFTEIVEKTSKEIVGRNLLEHYISVSTKGNWLSMTIEGEKDCWEISYDRNTKEWKAESLISRKRISKFRGDMDTVDITDEPIMMECFVDHSLIELYLNQRKCMTLRNYDFCEKNEYRVKSDCVPEISLRKFRKRTEG